ncbi:MAG: arylsulfotransferase family protein, partial [Planctomycetota bacterium]
DGEGGRRREDVEPGALVAWTVATASSIRTSGSTAVALLGVGVVRAAVQRRSVRSLILWALAINGAWLAFRIQTYADLLPNTFHLKAFTELEEGGRFAAGVRYLFEATAPYGTLPVATGGVALLLARRSRVPERLALIGIALAVAAPVVQTGGSSMHYYYLAFPITLSLLALGGLVEELRPRWAGAALAALLVAWTGARYPATLSGHPVLGDERQAVLPAADVVTDPSFFRRRPPLEGQWPEPDAMRAYADGLRANGYASWTDSGWCNAIYANFDVRSVHPYGLTDAVLSRVRTPEVKRGHKPALAALAVDLIEVQRRAVARGERIGRDTYTDAILGGTAPRWMDANARAIGLAQAKAFSGDWSFLGKLQLALMAVPAIELPLTAEEAAPEGFWYAARPASRPRGPRLDGLGYAGAVERDRGGWTGARVLDADGVAPGLNLYSSGHAPEARLVDANGALVHRWALPYDSIPGAPPLDHTSQLGWRRVRLLDDGSLVALHDGLLALKVDRDSNLVWWYGGRAHHDLDVAADGSIWTLARRVARVPEITERAPILDEGIVRLSTNGEPEYELRLVDAFRGTPWMPLLQDAAETDRVEIELDGERALDLFHANSIRVLDGSIDHPAFTAGRILLCLRELNALCVVDPEAGRVVWFSTGPWRSPHDPRPTGRGTFTLFDNRGGPGGLSRVLELVPDASDPLRVWGPSAGLDSPICGTARPLPGGNLLVTESTGGRALEVDPSGKTVWSFRTPHRAGPTADWIAVLYEVERVQSRDALPWLEAGRADPGAGVDAPGGAAAPSAAPPGDG